MFSHAFHKFMLEADFGVLDGGHKPTSASLDVKQVQLLFRTHFNFIRSSVYGAAIKLITVFGV